MESKSPVPFSQSFVSEKEIAYATESLQSTRTAGNGVFTHRCERLMRDLTGGAQVLLTSSCTASLEIAALALDVRPGDEVIMPSFTFVSTANAFCLRGAVPKFVDIETDTLNIDIDAVQAAITDRTRAIVPIHYAGISCDMDRLLEIARRRGIPVVEDAAQAFLCGYRGRPLGTIGELGCYSFHETKTFSAGECGAIAVNDSALLGKIEIIREKGTNRKAFFSGQVDRYTWMDLGSSYLPSDIIAAVLLAQLEQRDDILERRRCVFEKYDRLLAPLYERGLLRGPVVPRWMQINYHIYYVLTEDAETRRGLLDFLKARGILATFHFVPLHQSAYAQRAGIDERLPHTEDLAARLVRLPLFSEMTDQQQGLVVDRILEFFSGPKGH
ncbi:MAG: dTDP-4-amino-4,6-dideoxygalactose transaminase [Gammaproteobacteria bacterium]|nr:dTDP-4-amino-4,6-dideoxygalactose transaminase [Gammaproteobacteria bacterium]